MDQLRELYEEFTVPLSTQPVEGMELRGITFETFQLMIHLEREKHYYLGFEDGSYTR